MPKNNVKEAAAAKAKKQKVILIAAAVLLAALFAFEGTRMMKRGGSSAVPTTTTSVGAPVSETPPAGATTPSGAVAAVVPSGKAVAVVSGVPLTRGAEMDAATNQLVSFTLFDVKDPFVPQQDATPALTSEQKASDAYYNANGEAPPAGSTGDSSAPQGGSTADTGSSTGSTGSGEKAAPAPPVIYATINFQDKAQQVKVKDKFPADEPMFVLKSLKKKKAKIAVAGGSFDDSETFTLKLNKKVTLVNTATGVRYEIELVYTGATPEVIQSFTTTTGSTSTEQQTTTTTTTDATSNANAG